MPSSITKIVVLTLSCALLTDSLRAFAGVVPAPSLCRESAVFSTETLSLRGRQQPHSRLNLTVTIEQRREEIELLRKHRLVPLVLLLIALVPSIKPALAQQEIPPSWDRAWVKVELGNQVRALHFMVAALQPQTFLPPDPPKDLNGRPLALLPRDDGRIAAAVKQLHGAVSQGDSRDQANAIHQLADLLMKPFEPGPQDTAAIQHLADPAFAETVNVLRRQLGNQNDQHSNMGSLVILAAIPFTGERFAEILPQIMRAESRKRPVRMGHLDLTPYVDNNPELNFKVFEMSRFAWEVACRKPGAARGFLNLLIEWVFGSLKNQYKEARIPFIPADFMYYLTLHPDTVELLRSDPKAFRAMVALWREGFDDHWEEGDHPNNRIPFGHYGRRMFRMGGRDGHFYQSLEFLYEMGTEEARKALEDGLAAFERNRKSVRKHPHHLAAARSAVRDFHVRHRDLFSARQMQKFFGAFPLMGLLLEIPFALQRRHMETRHLTWIGRLTPEGNIVLNPDAGAFMTAWAFFHEWGHKGVAILYTLLGFERSESSEEKWASALDYLTWVPSLILAPAVAVARHPWTNFARHRFPSSSAASYLNILGAAVTIPWVLHRFFPDLASTEILAYAVFAVIVELIRHELGHWVQLRQVDGKEVKWSFNHGARWVRGMGIHNAQGYSGIWASLLSLAANSILFYVGAISLPLYAALAIASLFYAASLADWSAHWKQSRHLYARPSFLMLGLYVFNLPATLATFLLSIPFTALGLFSNGLAWWANAMIGLAMSSVGSIFLVAFATGIWLLINRPRLRQLDVMNYLRRLRRDGSAAQRLDPKSIEEDMALLAGVQEDLASLIRGASIYVVKDLPAFPARRGSKDFDLFYVESTQKKIYIPNSLWERLVTIPSGRALLLAEIAASLRGSTLDPEHHSGFGKPANRFLESWRTEVRDLLGKAPSGKLLSYFKPWKKGFPQWRIDMINGLYNIIYIAFWIYRGRILLNAILVKVGLSNHRLAFDAMQYQESQIIGQIKNFLGLFPEQRISSLKRILADDQTLPHPTDGLFSFLEKTMHFDPDWRVRQQAVLTLSGRINRLLSAEETRERYKGRASAGLLMELQKLMYSETEETVRQTVMFELKRLDEEWGIKPLPPSGSAMELCGNGLSEPLVALIRFAINDAQQNVFGKPSLINNAALDPDREFQAFSPSIYMYSVDLSPKALKKALKLAKKNKLPFAEELSEVDLPSEDTLVSIPLSGKNNRLYINQSKLPYLLKKSSIWMSKWRAHERLHFQHPDWIEALIQEQAPLPSIWDEDTEQLLVVPMKTPEADHEHHEQRFMEETERLRAQLTSNRAVLNILFDDPDVFVQSWNASRNAALDDFRHRGSVESLLNRMESLHALAQLTLAAAGAQTTVSLLVSPNATGLSQSEIMDFCYQRLDGTAGVVRVKFEKDVKSKMLFRMTGYVYRIDQQSRRQPVNSFRVGIDLSLDQIRFERKIHLDMGDDVQEGYFIHQEPWSHNKPLTLAFTDDRNQTLWMFQQEFSLRLLNWHSRMIGIASVDEVPAFATQVAGSDTSSAQPPRRGFPQGSLRKAISQAIVLIMVLIHSYPSSRSPASLSAA